MERGAGFRPKRPPVRRVTANAIVAINMGFFRKAAGLTQEELGDRIGWGKSVVSTAERSSDAKRVRNFTADDVIAIADALGLPFAALFLPPPDDGIDFRYVLDVPGSEGRPVRDLQPVIYLASRDDPSPAAVAYEKRMLESGSAPVPDVVADARREADQIPAAGAPAAESELQEQQGQDEAMDTAARVLAIALATAEKAIEDARREGDDTLGRVRGEAERILSLARNQAEQITLDAKKRAEVLERDAQERHRNAMGSLVEEREQLQSRVEALREFEREYRGRLRAFLEGHYRDFWAGVEGKGVDADQLLAAMREQASQRGIGNVTALLLGEDGIYDVVRLDELAEEEAGTPADPDVPGVSQNVPGEDDSP